MPIPDMKPSFTELELPVAVGTIMQNSTSGRLFAIGDVHGHLDRLSRLLERLALQSDDTLVMLGDVVNRGPDTKGVIDRLIEVRKQCKLVCVMGNHEEAMLDGRRNRYALSQWEEMGGFETLMSYGSDGRLKDIPDHHWDFLDSFVSYHESDDFIFVHANYDPHLTMSDQSALVLRWTSFDEANQKPHVSGKTAVCGHTPGPVRDLGFAICIDTGCGMGGPLSAIRLPERELISVGN
jgi:serine/threonine protein phosphatase 1